MNGMFSSYLFQSFVHWFRLLGFISKTVFFVVPVLLFLVRFVMFFGMVSRYLNDGTLLEVQ